MSWVSKLRRGEGPFWGRMKRTVRAILSFHIPVNGLTRPVFRVAYRFHVFVRESWIWLRRFFWNEPLFRSQCESVGPGFQMEEMPYISGTGRILIGEGVRLSGKPSITFGRQGDSGLPELVIGDESFIGHMCAFSIGRSIRIGKHCLLAGGVSVLDMDGHPVDAAQRRAGEPTPPDAIAPVVIGDDVWIGGGALILKGVTIGERAIVAARSVVTKDVPPDTVVAGNPARVVREFPPANGPSPGEVSSDARSLQAN
jgi:acetyltransferase-like isoleucine patch superfamily enzyme